MMHVDELESIWKHDRSLMTALSQYLPEGTEVDRINLMFLIFVSTHNTLPVAV
jgi:hypothetical protein